MERIVKTDMCVPANCNVPPFRTGKTAREAANADHYANLLRNVSPSRFARCDLLSVVYTEVRTP